MIPPHLSLSAAIARLSADATYAGFGEDGTISIGLYMPIGNDPQTPHDRDELYVIAAGAGTLRRGDETIAFTPGDLLHVPAHMPHSFDRFDTGLTAWVIFHGPVRPRPAEPPR